MSGLAGVPVVAVLEGHGAEPARGDFPAGFVGGEDYRRAVYAWRDAVTDEANRAFDLAFRKALETKKRESTA